MIFFHNHVHEALKNEHFFVNNLLFKIINKKDTTTKKLSFFQKLDIIVCIYAYNILKLYLSIVLWYLESFIN